MDLFIVNRYDEKQPEVNNYDHLSELLKKIDLKKQERANQQKIKDDKKKPEDEEVNNNLACKKKRKKSTPQDTEAKKTKLEPENETDDVEVPSEKTPKPKVIVEDDQQDFMILGAAAHQKLGTVKRVLPNWLAHPEIISADLNNSVPLDDFQDKLDQQLMENLRANGITKLFPVQVSALNWMLKCISDREMGWRVRDTCFSAPTGSGKTLAYVLPIIQQLQKRLTKKIRCLIVLPVQELATQVYKVITKYSAQTNLKTGLISAAVSSQGSVIIKKTERGEFISRVDIVVATPGPLIDYIEKTEGFSLDDLEFLVIDEADKTTDWLKYIPAYHRNLQPLTIKKSHLIPPAQKILLSATLSQDPEKLSRLGLFQPILFTSVLESDENQDINQGKEVTEFLGKYTSPLELTERSIQCDLQYKPLAVVKLLLSQKLKYKTLIFTNSGESAHRLSLLLKLLLTDKNLTVDTLSAQLTPLKRAKILQNFMTGEIKVLVSSDALARGLDIPGVKLVISYDLPKYIKTYIHRIGRTGRAGNKGTAVSILTPNQINKFNEMLSVHKNQLTLEQIDDIESLADELNYQMNLEKLSEQLNELKTKQLDKIKKNKNRSKLIKK